MYNEKNYLGVDIVVCISSSYESMALYKDFKDMGFTYIQDRGGPLITVGHLDERPICIAPLIHTVSGVKILYVEATSGLVDWDLIETWIKLRVKEGVHIHKCPMNMFSEVRQKVDDIKEGRLKKHIMFTYKGEKRYLKSIEFNADLRRRIVTSTADQFEGMYDCPIKLETLLKTIRDGMSPITDGKELGFCEFNVV